MEPEDARTRSDNAKRSEKDSASSSELVVLSSTIPRRARLRGKNPVRNPWAGQHQPHLNRRFSTRLSLYGREVEEVVVVSIYELVKGGPQFSPAHFASVPSTRSFLNACQPS